MSVTDKAKTAAKSAKGKVKETTGKATGNERMEAAGKVDQGKAHAGHTANKAKHTTKNVGREAKGKVREVGGAVTGDNSQQAKGKVEQVTARAKERLNK